MAARTADHTYSPSTIPSVDGQGCLHRRQLADGTFSRRTCKLPERAHKAVVQSRSTTCPKRSCGRLSGHKGEHRATLTKSAASVAEQPVAAPAEQARKARKPRVVVIPMADYTRLVASGIKVRRVRRYIVSERPSSRLA